MEHLFPYSVYHSGPVRDDIEAFVRSGADGIELLTGYGPVDPVFKGVSKGVHLPYATDWYTSWSGDPGVSGMSDEEIRFLYHGRDREDIVRNLRSAIVNASAIGPAYGIMHGGSVSLDELFTGGQRYDNEAVDALAEIMNTVVSQLKGGVPPFTILFENMWWSGIRLLDDREMRRLERKLEFEDWGFCLDTGHMMNAVGTRNSEAEAITSLTAVFDDYPEDMRKKIMVMHLHLSTSCILPAVPDVSRMTSAEKLSAAYEMVCRTDQHRPFTLPECASLVNRIRPEFVTHEIPYTGAGLDGTRAQRALFP